MNEWWSQLSQQELDALYGEYRAYNYNATYRDWMGLLQSGQLNNFYNNPQLANNPLSKEGIAQNPDISNVGYGYTPTPKMDMNKVGSVLDTDSSLLANPVANTIPSGPNFGSQYVTDFRNQLSNIRENGLMNDISPRINSTYTNVQGGQAADVLGKHANAQALGSLKTAGLNFAGELVKDMEKERTAYQAPTQSFANIAGSALQGAGQGSKFGPIGTAVGAIAGGIKAFTQRAEQIDQWHENLADTRSAQLAANTGAMRDYQRAMYGYNSTGGPSAGPYAKYGGKVDAIKMDNGGPTPKPPTYTKQYTQWGTDIDALNKAGKLAWEDVMRAQAARSQEVYQMAQKLGMRFPEAVAAQFAYESGWGNNQPAPNSVFGIKADPTFQARLERAGIPYSVGDQVQTGEYVNGKKTSEDAVFLGFPTLEDSMRAYAEFINQPRYAAARQAANPQQYLEALKAAGYATEPNYPQEAMRIAATIQKRQRQYPMQVYTPPAAQSQVTSAYDMLMKNPTYRMISQANKKELGGPNTIPQYETEGGEVILSNPNEKPVSLGTGAYKKMNMGGQLHKAVGPKHSNGGIPTKGADGGYVFSDAMKFDASAILNMLR